MNASTVIFYLLGSLVLTFGVLTVFTRKIFRAAVYLLLALIGVAGIYILMDMQFVAALQIVIYVGGIVVLIIFSIFLTHKSGERLPSRLPRHMLYTLVLPAAGLVLTTWVLANHLFTPTSSPAVPHDVETIGRQLLNYTTNGYVFPFEVISILLLAALVGSIVIAMKSKKTEGENKK